MVSIVGRPNVGKSTLINALAGEKIAIVSDKPQTTRNRIMGVVSKGETQVVFMDTPGLHKPKTKLGEYMVKVVRESVTDVDAILMLVHPVDEIGAAEEALIQSIEASGLPAILIINKIDTVDASRLFPVIEKYSDRFNFSAIIPISAKNGDGVDLVMDEVEKFIPEGYALFPEDMVSDQPERVMIAEIIREKLLNCLNREVPHGTAVEITKFTERENEIIDVCATIYCEKDSHKGIIIGKRGAMLKKISTLSREEIEKFMGTKVYLETWVKVKENWRESDFLLRNFGYE